MIAFRCDGGARVGAGHVARCLQIALAFEAAGTATRFVGTYGGIAADLLAAAGVTSVAPAGDETLGVGAGVRAVVVDSYEIEPARIEAAGRALPLAAVVDDGAAPAVAAALSYHLDAEQRIAVPGETRRILGVDWAPVSPALSAARRARGLASALVTAGGGDAGREVARDAAMALLAIDPALEVFVAAPGAPLVEDARVTWDTLRGGLAERIAWADVAVSAAGSTPYDLACAGVPMALRAFAANQRPILRAFVDRGLASGDVSRLGDAGARAALAAAGPRHVDGYGAFRARDALAAAFAGRPAPRVLRYRPATAADADRLLAWRNDPHVREMSFRPDPIGIAQHRAWLAGVLADAERTLLVAESGGAPVGTVRFDRDRARAQISIAVAPEARGRGLGTQMIAETTELQLAAHPQLADVLAEVQARNLPSLKAFERAGYLPAAADAPAGRGVTLVRTRSSRDRAEREQEPS